MNDTFVILTGALALWLVGRRMPQYRESAEEVGWRAGYLAGALAGVYALSRSVGILPSVVVAVAAALAVSGGAWMALPLFDLLILPLCRLLHSLVMIPVRLVWRRKYTTALGSFVDAVQKIEIAREKREAEREANKPTPAQRITLLRQRHAEKCAELQQTLSGYELQAALEEAKQKLLRDINEVM